MKAIEIRKRWQKAADFLTTKNSVKPTWERDSEFRQSVGKVRTKSQSKKRQAAKRK